MTITTTRIDAQTAIVNPGAELDEQHAKTLRDTIGQLRADGVERFVVDLSSVEAIDRVGLGVLRDAWRQGGRDRVLLAAPTQRVRNYLDVVSFPVPIIDRVEWAVRCLQRDAAEKAA